MNSDERWLLPATDVLLEGWHPEVLIDQRHLRRPGRSFLRCLVSIQVSELRMN